MSENGKALLISLMIFFGLFVFGTAIIPPSNIHGFEFLGVVVGPALISMANYLKMIWK